MIYAQLIKSDSYVQTWGCRKKQHPGNKRTARDGAVIRHRLCLIVHSEACISASSIGLSRTALLYTYGLDYSVVQLFLIELLGTGLSLPVHLQCLGEYEWSSMHLIFFESESEFLVNYVLCGWVDSLRHVHLLPVNLQKKILDKVLMKVFFCIN